MMQNWFDPDLYIVILVIGLAGLVALTAVLYRRLCGVLFVLYKFVILALPVAIARIQLGEADFWMGYMQGLHSRFMGPTVIYILVYMSVLVAGILLLIRLNDLKIKVPVLNVKFSASYGLLLLIGISAIAKIYLISTGAWFFDGFEGEGKVAGKFDFFATSLSNVDLFGLVGAAIYIRRDIRGVWPIFLMGIIMGLLFALVSGSKQTVIMASLPIIVLMLVRLKSFQARASFLAISLLFVLAVFPQFQLYTHAVRQAGTFPPTLDAVQANAERISREYDQVTYGRLDYFVAFYKMLGAYENTGFDPKGYGYFSSVTGLLPRFVWAGKPNYGAIGNEVARQLNFGAAYDYKTSVGVTPIGEAFLLHGVLGVLLAGFYAAFFIVLIDRLAENRVLQGGMIVVAIHFMKQDWLALALPGLVMGTAISYLAGSVILNLREKAAT